MCYHKEITRVGVTAPAYTAEKCFANYISIKVNNSVKKYMKVVGHHNDIHSIGILRRYIIITLMWQAFILEINGQRML